jgi:dTDP-4-amino-4,6-dideoxygalactose transaminase
VIFWEDRLVKVPFSRPAIVGNEEKYIVEALHSPKWCGRGSKTLELEALVKKTLDVKHAFFLTSCSAALEVSCLLSDVGPGDEVIVPSFGFVSAANAVALRGAKPVFADIEMDTWNISARTVRPLITPKTKAVIMVHYNGLAAGVDELRELCREKSLFLIEDAAQSLGAKMNGAFIGPTPWTACFSLHDTKNLTSGEGGLLVTDSEELAGRIEILIEKGTNRQRFFRGQVDKYTWVDIGSSYIGADLLAAVGLAQLEKISEITDRRRQIWATYSRMLENFRPKVILQTEIAGFETNGHVAGFLVDTERRGEILSQLQSEGVGATFHYVPLHDSPYAKKLGSTGSFDLPNTRRVSEGLIRLPIFYSMTEAEVQFVTNKTAEVLETYLS